MRFFSRSGVLNGNKVSRKCEGSYDILEADVFLQADSKKKGKMPYIKAQTPSLSEHELASKDRTEACDYALLPVFFRRCRAECIMFNTASAKKKNGMYGGLILSGKTAAGTSGCM